MTTHGAPHRLGRVSFALIAASIIASAAISFAMDVVLIRYSTDLTAVDVVGAAVFNGTAILLSLVGGIIEWRRPGHAIGRLMMLAGPTLRVRLDGLEHGHLLQPLIDPWPTWCSAGRCTCFSWPAVALIIGWIPLLFPTGTLPGPRWRVPAAVVLVLIGVGLIGLSVPPRRDRRRVWLREPVRRRLVARHPPAVRRCDPARGAGEPRPGGRGGDHPIPSRRSDRPAPDPVVRHRRSPHPTLGLVAILIEVALRSAGGAGADAPNALITVLPSYAVILALPIAIGIAVTRYRLYEIDRLISRTIGWALVTGVLVVVFAGMVVGLQAILDRVTQGETLAVAASTLVAFALFQPVRRRVQALVDRRFDRARYDGDRTAAAFAERLREQVDLAGLEADIAGVVEGALRPTSVGVWIRRPGHRGAA